MQLSEHFQQSEFERRAPVPPECIPLLKGFCVSILEPIRAKFGALRVTSGYRAPDDNKATGGVQQSQHIYNAAHCAADFQAESHGVFEVFNWIRLESGLQFDQVILEYDKAAPADSSRACVHTSYTSGTPRRMALVGNTHGEGAYAKVQVV